MPGSTAWSTWAFYSPGWVCPAGWTTATVVSRNMTDSIRATDIFSLLTPDETAGFCCPSGYTYSHPTVLPSSVPYGPRCISTMIQGDFVYQECGADGKSELHTVAVGTGKFTTLTSWATTEFDSDWDGFEWTTWAATTDTVISTITIDAPRNAMTTAPAVQLV
ncbi:uncharacterized protein THITE_2039480, partial [Thermothielavioides terrestris NRRL 8126]